ncbi:MAG: 50S ribosomal protein L11 methyltransferase [Gammaproteobacteria bacterium]|nr:50S ribosomal protein L11 methyltransferase [Gammaproteobacteria bacterium]
MPWLKLKLRTNQDQAQALADAFEEWGAISVTLEDAADQPLFETHWDRSPLWSEVRVTGLFPEHTDTDDILSRTRERLGLAENPPHQIDLLGDEDWAHSWMAHYKSELPADLQADIVIANILFGTLIELAPEIKARVRPGGWLVLSGLLGNDQAVEVRPHYEPPFAFEQRERQQWVLLAGRKPG